MMKSIMNTRTDAEKTDVNLLFTMTNCPLLLVGINYKFVCLVDYFTMKIFQCAKISAVLMKLAFVRGSLNTREPCQRLNFRILSHFSHFV